MFFSLFLFVCVKCFQLSNVCPVYKKMQVNVICRNWILWKVCSMYFIHHKWSWNLSLYIFCLAYSLFSYFGEGIFLFSKSICSITTMLLILCLNLNLNPFLSFSLHSSISFNHLIFAFFFFYLYQSKPISYCYGY